MDDHARLKDAKVFRSLGWEPGTNLAVSVCKDGMVTLSPSRVPGLVCLSLDERGRLMLTVAVREVLGAVPGASVLIVPSSVPGTAVLVGPDALLRALGGPDVAA